MEHSSVWDPIVAAICVVGSTERAHRTGIGVMMTGEEAPVAVKEDNERIVQTDRRASYSYGSPIDDFSPYILIPIMFSYGLLFLCCTSNHPVFLVPVLALGFCNNG